MHTLLEPKAIRHLLGRRQPLDLLDVTSYVTGRSVMVTGAGGSIGVKLCEKLIQMQPKTLILYEMSEFALYQIDRCLQEHREVTKIVPVLGNLSSSSKLQRLMTVFEVETIYHAAAYKHVPLVERNPIAGLENNVWSTKALVDAARAVKIQNLVLVSTDKAVNPTNVMGASKRLAEYIALSGQTPYRVVRFGNVLWSNGSVLPLFYEQLMTTRRLTITHPEVTRYFMSIDEAVDLILQSTALADSICVLDMGAPVKIEDVARRLAKLLGIDRYEVQYIGLRPGEKLYEELTLGENLHETGHPYIKAAQETIPGYEMIDSWLRRLELLCNHWDVGGIRKMLNCIVPGFDSWCGIVDDVWVEENVVKAGQDLDDCFWRVSA